MKRRNVFRVGAAYVVLAWILLQVGEVVFEALRLDSSAQTILLAILALGLIPTLVFAWVFELTPEGLKRDPGSPHEDAIGHRTAKRLDWVVIVLLILAMGMYLADRLWVQEPAAEPVAQATFEPAGLDALPTKQGVSIAVLPFANMSGITENEYFSDGITEEILNTLVRVGGLSVASRTSSFRYKSTEAGIPQIASELKVAYVLEGSVRRVEDRVRITVQLIDATEDRHVWSETYDRNLADIFAVQEEIARAISDQLRISLDLIPAGELVPDRTDDATVVELFLRGRSLYQQRGTAILDAITVLEQAVERDPGYAPAWVILALSYWNSSDFIPELMEPLKRAEQIGKGDYAIEQARILAPDNHIVRFYQGINQIYGDHDPVKGLANLRDAVAEDPNNDILLEDFGQALSRTGYLAEAVEVYERIVSIDPQNSYYRISLGRTLGRAGQVQRGIEEMMIALEAEDRASFYHINYFNLLIGSNRLAELPPALERAQADLDVNPDWVDLGLKIEQLSDWLADGMTATEPETGKAIYYFGHLGFMTADSLFETVSKEGKELEIIHLVANQADAALLKHPGFKSAVRTVNLDKAWRVYGFPEFCRPLGAEDFECGT